jgi:hypothetical protein
MPGLRDLQAAFAAHLAGEDRPDLAAAIKGDTLPAAARLRVHRHHVRQSLASALASTFPTVRALVGEGFFLTMAQAFVAGSLPGQPVLSEYGHGFPAHVAAYGPAASLPYLADVARLDWALNLAFQAPWSGRLTREDLAGMEPERLAGLKLVLAAGATLLRSSYPIDRIWRAAQPEASPDPVRLEEGPATLLVLRTPDDAAFLALSSAEAAFVRSLDEDRTLGDAAQAAFSSEPDFDLATTFARLVASGAFAALQHESPW